MLGRVARDKGSSLFALVVSDEEKKLLNFDIQNNSNKTVKKIKVSIRQFADICLFSTAQYKCTVAEIESE
jgi:hypothetical protein